MFCRGARCVLGLARSIARRFSSPVIVHDIEPFVRVWQDEETGHEIEFGIIDGIVMPARGVSRMEPSPADLVGNIEKMKLVICASFLEESAHPKSRRDRIGVQIQYNGQAETKQADDMGRKDFAQSCRKARVVGDRRDFDRKQAGEPTILAENNCILSFAESGGKGGFSSGHLAAKHMQGGARTNHGNDLCRRTAGRF
jgi:hypothetical protein